MTDSSSPATAFAAHVKLIIANCNQNGAPDEVRFVGAMPADGSDAHSNQRVTQRPCGPCARANVLYFPFSIITSFAALAFVVAGAMYAGGASAEDTIKSETPTQDHMKGDAMKGDAMKGDP